MSEELFARLARLRREERAVPEALPRPTPLPGWLTTRFAAREALGEELEEEPARVPGRSLDPPQELAEQRSARGTFAARTRVFAAEHLHGEWGLGEVLSASGEELGWLARDPTLAALEPARSVYLDIETTGLAGGAGTIPFLIALGTFEAGEFRLWQAFLRDPGEEAAALAEVAERIDAASGVVSFFGKSFDRHRLEDKMRVHGIAPPFAAKPHLDLYHPLRRLYGGCYRDGRLATFEQELCGVARENDLSGALAPAAWFDFLAGRPHRLEGVFRHNELDVLSLVSLGAHLACARREARPDGRALGGPGRARARAIAELHARRREHAAALEWLERALTRSGSDEGALWFRHADCLRRLGELERALEEHLRLARERADALAAHAWCEVARLARRLKLAELEEEARAQGALAVERTCTGKSRARLLARLQPVPRTRPIAASVQIKSLDGPATRHCATNG